MNTTLIRSALFGLSLAVLGSGSGSALADYNDWHDAPANASPWQKTFAEPRHESRQRFTQIESRQAKQRERIADGRRSGELTPRELDRLRDEQRSIEHLQRQFMSDGFMSAREFRILDTQLNAASEHIKREKHDRQAMDDSPRYYSEQGNRYGW
jgi:hypothetical protein